MNYQYAIQSDEFGNSIKNDNGIYKVYVKQGSGQKEKIAGIKSEEVLHVKRSINQKNKKLNSYPLNYWIIKNANIKNVLLKDEKGYYLIPVRTILENGKFIRSRKQRGLMLQIFFDISLLAKHYKDVSNIQTFY